MAWLCPVCGAAVVVDCHDTDEGRLYEHADHCPNGCLDSDFAYGCSRERIGRREWAWHWTETPEEWRKRRAERLAAIEEMRRERKEGHGIDPAATDGAPR